MKRLAILGLLLMFSASNLLAERPAWCKDGYVCLPTEVALERERRIIKLELDLEERKADRLKRLGFTIGPTVAYSSGTTDTFIPVVVGFGVTWGLRF